MCSKPGHLPRADAHGAHRGGHSDRRRTVDWRAARARCLQAQIGDSFRAAGFPAGEIDGYSRVVMQRIAALKGLNGQGHSQLRGV